MKRTTDISLAADQLKAGQLVAFPTETVYGLGGDACDDRAVAAIFQAKGRPQFNPLIVHVASFIDAKKLAKFNPLAEKLATTLWPGPMTLVVPRAPDCPVSLLVSAGLDSLAIRVPSHPLAQAFLSQVDTPIAAPSANPSGSISPTSADHVISGLAGNIDTVLDGGDCPVGVESTIISCLTNTPKILRHGGLARKDIEAVLATTIADGQQNSKAPTAPGQLQSHYAPKALVRLNVTEPADDEVLLGFGHEQSSAKFNLSPSGDVTEAAANLFKLLHQLDAQGHAKIAVSPIPNEGLGEAINDRLLRAATPRETP